MRQAFFQPRAKMPGLITVEEALALDWYPHPVPFRWPAARSPQVRSPRAQAC